MFTLCTLNPSKHYQLTGLSKLSMAKLFMSPGPAAAKLPPVRDLYLAFVTNFSVRSSIRLLFFSLEEDRETGVYCCPFEFKGPQYKQVKMIFNAHWDLRLLGIRHTFTVPCPRFRLLRSRESKLRRGAAIICLLFNLSIKFTLKWLQILC